MTSPRLTRPKYFWDINLEDWHLLHPVNRNSIKEKVKQNSYDYLHEIALARVSQEATERLLKPENRGVDFTGKKMREFALQEHSKKIKYSINPRTHPELYTEKWRKAYEEKFPEKETSTASAKETSGKERTPQRI